MKYGTLVRIPETENISAACEEKFSRLQEMGMDACQLVYKPKTYTLEAADIIRECALRHGVEISAQFCGFERPEVKFGSVEELKEQVMKDMQYGSDFFNI